MLCLAIDPFARVSVLKYDEHKENEILVYINQVQKVMSIFQIALHDQ